MQPIARGLQFERNIFFILEKNVIVLETNENRRNSGEKQKRNQTLLLEFQMRFVAAAVSPSYSRFISRRDKSRMTLGVLK